MNYLIQNIQVNFEKVHCNYPDQEIVKLTPKSLLFLDALGQANYKVHHH